VIRPPTADSPSGNHPSEKSGETAAPVAADAAVLGRLGIATDDVPLDALPAVEEASVSVAAVTIGRVATVGATGVDDPDVAGATFVGVGRTGAIAVAAEVAADEAVVTGLGIVAVVGAPLGLVAGGVASLVAFDFEAMPLRAALAHRAALCPGRVLPRRFAHAVGRAACEADALRA
jgi:hypothetical protein